MTRYVSVLNREPMGMKLRIFRFIVRSAKGFSAQPRADGDEALIHADLWPILLAVSVLNREPMGMKLHSKRLFLCAYLVSVLNREPMGMKPVAAAASGSVQSDVSVLNREPMGMKLQPLPLAATWRISFSAQPRADGDEAVITGNSSKHKNMFQCSTASRWG